MELKLENSWEILAKKMSTWIELAISNLPNLIVAIAVVVVFVILGKIAKKVLSQVLGRTSNNRAVNRLLQTLLYLVFLLAGLSTALGVLNLEKTLTSLLAGAGVIGLALGFAFQEIASNFISGIFIAFVKPYQVGDIVEVSGYQGTVHDINLRTTNLTTFQGLEVIVPNKEMFTKSLTNYTSTPERRVDIDVGVSYAEDLRKVEKIATEAVEKIDVRIKDKPIEFFYKGFGSSSIDFQIRFWVEYPGQMAYLRGTHQAIINIKEAFDQNGITIPFPIRTLDFGIKGGVDMSEPLKSAFQNRVQ